MRLFLKNFLFTVIAHGTLVVYAPLLIVRDRAPASSWSVFLALPAFVVGSAIYFWCVWDFAAFGRGTPMPLDAPKRLVIRGLYRYCRNPMYVGLITLILGWVLWFQTGLLLLYVALVALMFQLLTTLYEEPHLRRIFGADYEAYCARVGRWLPRWNRRGSPT
jgi:protein-S-isoprenylcysteine O-methyltransferase Ste14